MRKTEAAGLRLKVKSTRPVARVAAGGGATRRTIMRKVMPPQLDRVPRHLLSTESLLHLETWRAVAAKESFWAYRQFMHPEMKTGWFQKEVAFELQQFYDDLINGRRPVLVLEAPPQHGKSDSVTDFTQWLAGKLPELRQIYASYSDRLGVRANLRMQRAMDTSKYKAIFPDTKLNTSNVVTQSGQALRNREMLEFVGKDGSFRNTTIQGPITGESLDVGFIDDLMKGRAEASSPTTRDKTWDWLTDDFLTRFSEHAGLLIVLTRWHLDDPIGRMLDAPEFRYRIRVIRYPALAEVTELFPDGSICRNVGDPLFPELKSKEFLLIRKSVMTTAGWESVYQQNPIVSGGDTFPVDLMRTVPFMPKGTKAIKRVRYWDKAGTSGGGKFTAGVLMAELNDGRFLIEDVVRGQWGALERERNIKRAAIDDGKDVTVWVEQEPGSGGKESAERTIAMLAGWNAHKDKVTGDKATRAEPYAAQCQGENVLLLAGVWNKPFLDEHEFFPNGPFKDQVDAAGGAFAKLTGVGAEAGMLW